MLIEKANGAQTQVALIPYAGMVNPEHLNQRSCVPMVIIEENDVDENTQSFYLEDLFVKDFLRKSQECRQTEQIHSLPIEIRLGTVYTYQNRRQTVQYPKCLHSLNVTADFLHNEEHRAREEKNFLITFNKNKGINDLQMFEHDLTCTGFRQTDDFQLTYRLYLCHAKKRIILELKRDIKDPRYFSVKRLLRYSTKFRHIDVVKSKHHSNYPQTFDDIFDIRTSMGKASDEEELHINDEYCSFLHIKDLEKCVLERKSPDGQVVFHFNRQLVPFFDFFQIKRTRTYHYSCVDSRFFGVKILLEQQTGYDLSARTKTTTPCLQTHNVITAKLQSTDVTEDEAKRMWAVGAWLSELATRCTNPFLPANKTFSRRPKHHVTSRRLVR